jgi:hypothetical protein
MHVVEMQLDGIVADRFDGEDFDGLLAAYRLALLGRVPLHFRRGREHTQYSAVSVWVSPSSKRTVRSLRSFESRSSVGQGSATSHLISSVCDTVAGHHALHPASGAFIAPLLGGA